MPEVTHSPAPASIPNDILNSVEAELRAEATPATPPPSYEPPPTQTSAPVTPPTEEPDPQEQERGYLRDRDYRQKTMALAEERRIHEAQRAQEFRQRQDEQRYLTEAQQAINNAQWLEARLNALRQQNNLPQPGQQPSAEQVHSLLQQQQQVLEQKFDQKMQAAITQSEIQRHTFEFDRQIKSFQSSLLKEFPELARPAYKGVEKLIVSSAFAQTPKNWEEAQELMRSDAAERAKDIKKTLADHEQAAVMRHTKQAHPAMEPKGGTAPVVQALKSGRLGSQQLQDAIMSDLLAEQASKR